MGRGIYKIFQIGILLTFGVRIFRGSSMGTIVLGMSVLILALMEGIALLERRAAGRATDGFSTKLVGVSTRLSGCSLYRLAQIAILLALAFELSIYHSAEGAVLLRSGALLIALVEGIGLFKRVVVDRPVGRAWSNLATGLISSFSVFLGLEMAFMFVPRSHGAGVALSEQVWLRRYQRPINSYGFRDAEPRKAVHAILFVGDSFTEGQGLADVRDRFSDIVGHELSAKRSDVTSINIGKRGYDTADEYGAMVRFIQQSGIEPSVVVLQYFGNDIDRVAMRNGLSFAGAKPYRNVPEPARVLVQGSYFLNFLYWLKPRGYDDGYREFLFGAYANPRIMAEHRKDLDRFVAFARAHAVDLVTVVFPFLLDTTTSNDLYVHDIVRYFAEQGMTAIDVSMLVEDLPASERVVNANDTHASKEVNRRVARAILEHVH